MKLRRVRGVAGLLALGLLTVPPTNAPAYPLDGYDSTGIGRLLAQRMVQEGKVSGRKRPPASCSRCRRSTSGSRIGKS